MPGGPIKKCGRDGGGWMASAGREFGGKEQGLTGCLVGGLKKECG